MAEENNKAGTQPIDAQNLSMAPVYLSPTSSAPTEISPFYRRTFIAIYKGYQREALAGAALYGIGGAIVGAITAAAFAPIAGISLLAALPLGMLAFGGIGALKGADTFGQAGMIAAGVSAAQEINEERRRAQDLLIQGHTGHELEQMAIHGKDMEKIEKQKSHQMFHGNIALWGAIGGALLAITAAAMYIYLGDTGKKITDFATNTLNLTASAEQVKLIATSFAAVGGALAGGLMFGLDRAYVRSWFRWFENVYDKGQSEDISPELLKGQQVNPNLLRPIVTRPELNGLGQEVRVIKGADSEAGISQGAPVPPLAQDMPTKTATPSSKVSTIAHAETVQPKLQIGDQVIA